MGNDVSLSQADIQRGPDAVRARLRGNVSANKRMLFTSEFGTLPKGCKCTPLGVAILSRDLDLLDAILAGGANLNKPVGLPTLYDFTPLQLAVFLGFPAGVRWLLDHGADPNAPLKLKRGVAALHVQELQPQPYRPGGAAACPSPSIQLSLDRPPHMRPGDTPLHLGIDFAAADLRIPPPVVSGRRMDVIEALIGHSATDLNRRNALGHTPLYQACKRQLELVVRLLAIHPRVDVTDGTPLFAAISAEEPQLVRVLLQAGAGRACAECNLLGQTPLSFALFRESVSFDCRAEIVALLVQAGSEVEPEMLSYAEERGWDSVLAALLSGTAGLRPSEVGQLAGAGEHDGQGTDQSAAAAVTAAATPTQTSATARAESGAPGGSPGSLLSAIPGHHHGPDYATPGLSTPSTTLAITDASTAIRTGADHGTGSGGKHGRGPASGGRAPGPSAPSPSSSAAAVVVPRRTALSWRWRRGPAPPAARPPLLVDAFRRNPIMVLFAPIIVLFPLMVIETVCVALGEVVRNVLTELMWVALFIAPAMLYGFYRGLRCLLPLVLKVLRCMAGVSEPRTGTGQQTIAVQSASGVFPVGNGAMEVAAPGAAAVPRSYLAESTALAEGGRTVASAADVTTAAAAGQAAGRVLQNPTAVAVTPDSWAAVGAELTLLDSTSTAAIGDQGTVPGQSLQTPAPMPYPDDSEQPYTGGPAEFPAARGHLLLPSDPWIGLGGVDQLRVGGVREGVPETVGATAAATGVSCVSVTTRGGGSAVISTQASPLRLLALLWRVYISLFVALGALVLSFFVVQLLTSGVEYGLRSVVPEPSVLGTCLRTRELRHRRRADASRNPDSGFAASLFVLALGLRLLGDMPFGRLLGAMVVCWVALEAAGLSADVWTEWQSWRSSSPGRIGSDGGEGVGDAPQRLWCDGDVVRHQATELPMAVAEELAAQWNAVSTAGGGGGSLGMAVTAASKEAEVDGGGGGGGGEGGVSGGLQGLCCVCMSSPAVMGFVHRDVVHCCLCADCEGALRRRGSASKCLICKCSARSVARVIVT